MSMIISKVWFESGLTAEEASRYSGELASDPWASDSMARLLAAFNHHALTGTAPFSMSIQDTLVYSLEGRTYLRVKRLPDGSRGIELRHPERALAGS